MNRRHSGPCIRALLYGPLLVALSSLSASAAVIELNAAVVAAAVDDGPQDGVFDAFLPPLNFGAVVNNGFTSSRTAFQFDLSSVPSDAVITTATLRVFVRVVEGTRHVAVHGYEGDGSISLSDFSLNGLVGNATLSPPGSHAVLFDATAFVTSLMSASVPFVGFNLREEPANASNFTVLFFDATGFEGPRLSIETVPEPASVWLLAVGLPGVLNRLRRRRSL